MRYTYDEEELDDDSEATGTRRSTRNSGVATPADQSRPTTTLSGRQVRSRVGGMYGESLLSGQNTDARSTPATDISDEPVRASRSGRAGVNRRVDEDAETSSEGEWDGGDEDEPDEPMEDLDDEEEASEDDGSDEEMEPRSLVVALRYGKGRSPSLQPTEVPKPAAKVEVVIPKPSPLSQTTTITPESSAPTGYLTPASTVNGTNGSAQPTPQHAPAAPPTNGLPPLHSVVPASMKKQSQLPFQPMPQHNLKPVVPQQSSAPTTQYQQPQ